MPDVPFDELVDRVATVLGEERPDVVATFGPDGITGHPDHIRIGEAATAAFRASPATADRASAGWSTAGSVSR